MPHYARLLTGLVFMAFAAGAAIWRFWKPPTGPVYEETGVLDPARRLWLQALLAEDKFIADDTIVPPYPGPKSRKRKARLVTALDALITDILSEPDGELEASDLAARMGLTVAALARTDPADIHRANGYMLEIWYLFGFCSAAGYFGPDDGGPVPEGRAEPLPPGWSVPDEARVIEPPVAPVEGQDVATTSS